MNKDQEWERAWWGNCTQTLGEEMKQLTYAKKMGLKFFHNGKSPFNIDMEDKSVLDIGGGPCSLLLKCVNVSGWVIDPCEYPEWINKRYEAANITLWKEQGEKLLNVMYEKAKFHEVWIYNVLQHTENPEKVIQNARKVSKIIRIFEWIDTYVSPGHPHILTEAKLNEWLGGLGATGMVNENTATGSAFWGVFKGEHYASS